MSRFGNMAMAPPQAMQPPPQLSSTPLPPPQQQQQQQQQQQGGMAPPPPAAPAESMESIWSMLNKPPASKPPLAPANQTAAEPKPTAAPPSHRSTQLSNLFNILQRLNSSVTAPKDVPGVSSQPTPSSLGSQQQFGSQQQVVGSVSAAPEPWPQGLGSTPAGPPGSGSGNSPLELELQPDSIEPLVLPEGCDDESKAKYAEQCKANRAERMRKRKERSEPLDEDSTEPGMQKKVARMMRNRESAQRSREKRQNYTDKLEAEVAVLKEEKAALADKVQEMEKAPPQAALTGEQLALLEELRSQVRDFQQRESKLDLPVLKPLRRHHTMPS